MMDMHATWLTLAAISADLVVFAIVTIFVIIGKIVQFIRDAQKKAGSAPSNEAAMAARQARLEALARQRRQQMRVEVGPTVQPQVVKPTNLTVAQAAQRQQAKAAYAKRAEALRRASQAPSRPSSRPAPGQQTAEARAEALQRAQEVAQRHAEQKAREQAMQQRQTAEAERAHRLNAIDEREAQLTQAAEKLRRERARLLGAGAAEQAEINHEYDTDSETHRRVRDSDSTAYDVHQDRGNRFRQALIGPDRTGLRNAIIFREILGPPLALQDDN